MLNYFIILLFFTCVSSQNLKYEGDSCIYNGTIGRCVSVYRCLSTILDIKSKVYPSLCSFDGHTPIICCTDCKLVNDTRLVLFNPELGILYKTGTSKAKDKCLDYIHNLEYSCKAELHEITYQTMLDPVENCTKVFDIYKGGVGFASGGRNAKKEEYPHMALLGYGDTVETASWLCGGSVISENFILTAAHCTFGPSIGSVKYIGLGVLKRSDPPEMWQRYDVKKAIIHPGYQPPSKYHDIALLETDRVIAFNKQVRPACLHVDDNNDIYAYATGWGALGHNQDLADVLQSVGLNEFTEEECTKFYKPGRLLMNGYNHTTQMCYGDRKDTAIPTDTCEGDSGGPLQSQQHERCVYTILGVTSFGRKCGSSGGSGMYTRVRHYVPWIEDIVWP